MLSAPFLVLLASALVPDMPPPLDRDVISTGSNKSPGAMIFERSDFGGEASTARARVTLSTARNWCAGWQPGTEAQVEDCAKGVVAQEGGKVYESRANCVTGELWSFDGRKYLFDGRVEGSRFDDGNIAIKDAETGKRIGTDNAANGLGYAVEWLALCPFGTPYDRVPVENTLHIGPDYQPYGMPAGHNGSDMFFDQRQQIIYYTRPKASISGTISENTVLFHGWITPGSGMQGVAYTYKKGCKPAPYIVQGYDQGGDRMVLTGKAPVRKGCDVVGYTDSSPNARLVFELAE